MSYHTKFGETTYFVKLTTSIKGSLSSLGFIVVLIACSFKIYIYIYLNPPSENDKLISLKLNGNS